MANDPKVTNPEAPEAPAKVMTKKSITKSQAAYAGNSHLDLVKATIIKDSDFYKKGDTDLVHPSLALILKEKGLIEGTGQPHTRPKFENKDITLDA